MKIAVCAASGQLGQTLLSRFVDHFGAESIIGVARSPEKIAQPDIEVREGNYDSLETLRKALADTHTVVLIPGMAEPDQRVKQHINVIEAAKDMGVKRIIFTSIIGGEKSGLFTPIVEAMRRTEKIIETSGLEWIIGRNGLYIEPDLEYLPEYIKAGVIANSAGQGRCAYTSRAEIADALVTLIETNRFDGGRYNLTGEAVTQKELAQALNRAFGTTLSYHLMSNHEFQESRVTDLGVKLGSIIAGIYEGISQGDFNVKSDFQKITGRQHKTLSEMIQCYKTEKGK